MYSPNILRYHKMTEFIGRWAGLKLKNFSLSQLSFLPINWKWQFNLIKKKTVAELVVKSIDFWTFFSIENVSNFKWEIASRYHCDLIDAGTSLCCRRWEWNFTAQQVEESSIELFTADATAADTSSDEKWCSMSVLWRAKSAHTIKANIWCKPVMNDKLLRLPLSSVIESSPQFHLCASLDHI